MKRRSFLFGSATALASWPFLRLFGQSGGASSQGPRRLVLFITANGLSTGETGNANRPDYFWPTATDITSSPVLDQLAPFAHKLQVVRGVDMKSAYMGQISPDHQPDFANALTGLQTIPGTDDASGPSVDQYIAERLQGATPYRSLHFGVKSGGHAPLWRAAGEAVRAENDPWVMRERLFGDFMQDPAELERIRLARRSVLDVVKADVEATRCRLGREQQAAFDLHLESIRSLERTVDGLGAACEPPTISEPVDASAYENFEDVARAQIDLAAMSLACDMTRVATIQLDASASGHPMVVDGNTYAWHSAIHDNGLDPAIRAAVGLANNRRVAANFAYLLAKLDGIPEGDGTVLDHSTVLWLAEQSLGCCHRRTDMGYVLAGGAGGYLKPGQKHRFYTGEVDGKDHPLGIPHNRLLITLCHAMGLADVTTFGDPGLSAGGPVSELLA